MNVADVYRRSTTWLVHNWLTTIPQIRLSGVRRRSSARWTRTRMVFCPRRSSFEVACPTSFSIRCWRLTNRASSRTRGRLRSSFSTVRVLVGIVAKTERSLQRRWHWHKLLSFRLLVTCGHDQFLAFFCAWSSFTNVCKSYILGICIESGISALLRRSSRHVYPKYFKVRCHSTCITCNGLQQRTRITSFVRRVHELFL